MALLNRWKSIVWTILIFIATTLPSNVLPNTSLLKIPHFDKIVHFGLFFVLAVFLLSENNRLRKLGGLTPKAIAIAISVSAILGVLIELLQYFYLPTRSGSYWDFLANILGAIVAVGLYKMINRITKSYI
jgi:VanZ family protein